MSLLGAQTIFWHFLSEQSIRPSLRPRDDGYHHKCKSHEPHSPHGLDSPLMEVPFGLDGRPQSAMHDEESHKEGPPTSPYGFKRKSSDP